MVHYNLDIERGWTTIAVWPGFIGSQAVHMEHIRASSRDFARMPNADRRILSCKRVLYVRLSRPQRIVMGHRLMPPFGRHNVP